MAIEKAVQLFADKNFCAGVMERCYDAKNATRFMRMFQSAVYKVPKLMLCTPESVRMVAYNLAELNLSPISAHGQAYLIPYYDRKNNKTDCQLQIGWRGLVTMAVRDGSARSIVSNVVYKGEHFKCSMGTNPFIEHLGDYDSQITRNLANIKCIYAIAELHDGSKIFEIMSINQLLEHKEKYGRPGPWETETVEMMRKTVVKKLCKYIPATNDSKLLRAIEIDNELSETFDVTPEAQVESVTQSIKKDLLTEALPIPGSLDKDLNESPSQWLDAEDDALRGMPIKDVPQNKMDSLQENNIDTIVESYIMIIKEAKTLPQLDETYKKYFKVLTHRSGVEQKHFKAMNDAADLHKAKLQAEI